MALTRRRTSPAIRCWQLAGTGLALAVAGLAITTVTHLLIGGAW